MPTYSGTVGASTDDARQQANGVMAALDVSNMDINNENQRIGARFTGINIPTGSTITVAYCQTYSNLDTQVTANTEVAAQKANNPGTFTLSNNDITNRTLTDEKANWTGGLNLNAYTNSPSLVSVIQELADLGYLEGGKSLVIILRGLSSSVAHRVRSWDVNPSQAMKMYIEWTEPVGGALSKIETVRLASKLRGLAR